MRLVVFCVALFACGGGEKDNSGTNTPGDDDDDSGCPVTEPDNLPDLTLELSGIDHQCEDQPQYIPDVPTATTWYIGDLEIDDCGEVTGTEIAYLYPNPKWEELDGFACIVTWDITGSIVDAFNVGTYGLQLEATVDPFNSTCPEDDNELTFYSGFEFMNLNYDVSESSDGTLTLHFGEGQRVGEEVAQGHFNANHVTYRTSSVQCALF
jgi:hypothetical protein